MYKQNVFVYGSFLLEILWIAGANTGGKGMKEYLSEIKQVLEEQKTNDSGLSSKEAADRLAEHGPNKLAEGKKESTP